MTGYWTLLRLDFAEALRSKWVALACSLYLALAAAFLWFGLRESSVLGFTGLSRVLLNLTNAVVIVCPLVVLLGTHGAIARARSGGFCELMLVQPIKRATWFFALLGSRLLILAGPFFVLMLASAVASFSLEAEPGMLAGAARSLAICVALIFCFVGIGLLVSALSQSSERALVCSLLLFVLVSALHDVLLISVLLRSTLPPELVFGLAALNPSEAARVGILASADPELAVLGPVGFWLANSLGSAKALALAIVWPLVLGGAATLAALRATERADLVA
jgi:ABC-2 type transport system permease protein